MDKETLNVIKNQTGSTDDLHIERIFYECDGDVVKTIMTISGIQEAAPRQPISAPNVFDDIRKIVNEKEEIFRKISKDI